MLKNPLNENHIDDISHALQTPLTILKGELELIEKCTLSNEKRDLFIRLVDKVSKTIHDLMSLDTINALGTQKQKEPVDIGAILENVVEIAQVNTNASCVNVSIEKHTQAKCVGIQGNLQLLFMYIISYILKVLNDRKEGSISIDLSETKNSLIISILINKFDLDPNDKENFFTPFYRMSFLPHSHTGNITGLELAIVYRIIELHEGSITIETSQKNTTTFNITLKRQVQ